MKVGVAFGESITSEKLGKRRNYDDGPLSKPSLRGYLLPLFIVFAMAPLFFRLLYVEVFQGKYYRSLSDENRIKTTTIHAQRGIIFDRNHIPLVFNIPGFRKVEKGKTTLVPREKALEMIARGEKDFEIDSLRQYPYQDVFAHVLGYVGQISKEELQSNLFPVYRAGDLLGKSGIEKQYEILLRGTDGKQLVEVDASGKSVRTLGQTEPTAGIDITLTLDVKLQKSAYEALKDVKKGAVVVSSPKGEILALVSKPSFDPNLFTLSAEQNSEHGQATQSAYESIDQILSDSDNQPLLNRAIAGVYPPGSTFKLVNAAAGLENKVIDENFEVTDTGILQVGAFSFANWYFTGYGKTEGQVNVVKAIKRSNDIFFYQLAQKVGPDKLSEMAKKLGVGEKSGIDLQGEASGLVPTTKWKEKEIGEPWYLGDTYHYGIGQGYLSTTPLQVNLWTSAIANGGTLYQPRLIKNTTNTTNTTNNPIRKNILSSKTFELIREGMIESCSPGGVAWPLFEFKIKNEKLKVDGKDIAEVPQSTTSAEFKDYRHVAIACKTGTAQHGNEETLPHAWITLFAPAYNPQIIVTVLAESSGEGSNVVAPVAKKILEEWFSR